jgi:hypothetical protein
MAKPKRTPVSAHQHTHRFSPPREFRLFDLTLELHLCIYEAYAKNQKTRCKTRGRDVKPGDEMEESEDGTEETTCE